MKSLLMEEFHLSVFVPRGLRNRDYVAIRRVLTSQRFHTRLSRAMRDVCRLYRGLRPARITVTR